MNPYNIKYVDAIDNSVHDLGNVLQYFNLLDHKDENEPLDKDALHAIRVRIQNAHSRLKGVLC